MTRAAWATAVLAGVTVLAGCAAPTAGRPAGLSVVAGFYPLAYVAERVGGDQVRVTNLTKPGAEPHDLELRPRDVATVADADLVLRLAGFQPALDDAISQAEPAHALDVTAAAGPPLPATQGGGSDPHVWLDPTRLASIGDAVAHEMAAIDPSHADAYATRAAALRRDLQSLDRGYRAGLARCDSRYLVTSHAAFAYLAARYHLTQVGISGPTPEAEPGAADLARVASFIREHDVTTVFAETLVSPALADTVARETGAVVAVLDPLEGLSADAGGSDYLSVMDDNLVVLRAGLGCR